MRAGGQFIFDDFLMTPAVTAHMRQVQLRAAYRSPANTDKLLWVTSLVDGPAQLITVVTWEDELDADGMLDRRRYRRLSLSWLEPTQTRQLLEETGYVSDHWSYLGNVDPNPAVQTNRMHHWLATDCHLQAEQELDPGEDIEVATLSEEEMRAAISSGEIRHALVLTALHRVFDLRTELGSDS